MFGSKPSPMKQSGKKKGSVVCGGASNRRLSLGGAMLAPRTDLDSTRATPNTRSYFQMESRNHGRKWSIVPCICRGYPGILNVCVASSVGLQQCLCFLMLGCNASSNSSVCVTFSKELNLIKPAGVVISTTEDKKKLQGQLITEQEAMFGSKPSPMKQSGKKKGRMSCGGTSNRRLSLGGAMLAPRTDLDSTRATPNTRHAKKNERQYNNRDDESPTSQNSLLQMLHNS
ncbi:65-kDa microtubule-associated protein 3-like protein [Tanacetum coccineum]|uniref:65-kDa microtubule-associated protein 3-like protein n=1 Tax=Tanacetum coccineum TaxID=301880 RepID=A0ABQ5BBI7_9ASTR